jgi:hypothetical protein
VSWYRPVSAPAWRGTGPVGKAVVERGCRVPQRFGTPRSELPLLRHPGEQLAHFVGVADKAVEALSNGELGGYSSPVEVVSCVLLPGLF